MPNVIFVVTGRNRLQWAQASLEGQLDWTGPHAWSGLDTGTNAQTTPQKPLSYRS
ncbi:hypothetical protein ACIPYR_36060 [Streptomyces parvus]|uniref:hypothetical protein n=1 Tax=Streptomyces parvus TaxID=66428 RepID=UPI00382C2311